ncbi:MAG: apolipoprotein N-acyltransferase [Cyanobacteria bacterium SZAS-4]|nr:apolipoprotein N-acyltransferase [Cyanobacteria bacterium SZAS-4]
MQSSEILIENLGPTTSVAWLQRFSSFEKLPFAFAFGCLLGLSSPGFDQSWLAWIGVAPLLVLLRGCSTRMEAFLTGLSFGVGFYLVSLSWCLGLFPLRWLGLDDWLGVQAAGLVWAVESVHEALLIGAFALMVFCLPLRAGYLPHFKRPFFPYLLSVPILWVFLQWTVGTSEFFVAMPVNQLAYSQAHQTQLIQIAKLGGSGLVDFLLILANCTVAEIFLEFSGAARRLQERIDQISPKAGCWVDALVVLILVLVACNWGAGQIEQTALTTRPGAESNFYTQTPVIPIAVLQGNVSIEEDRLKLSKPVEVADRYSKLASNLGVPIIALPEGLLNSDQMTPGNLAGRLKGVAAREKKEVLVGSIEAMRDGRVNGARLIGGTDKDNLYVKQRLVPFGEFAPLGPLGQRINERLPLSPDVFLKSKSARPLHSIWGGIGVSICVELIYPHIISNEVRHGANLLINVSNLGWFHQSFLNRQILAAAVMRAVENGRFFVLATNTGISAVIDPSGVITSVSYPSKRGALIDTVQFLYGHTPFSKMWWL